MVKDRRPQIYPNVVQCLITLTLDDLGGAPLGPGMPFLDNDICAERGGYLFLLGFSSLYDAIHGWMMRRMDGWMGKAS
jgi:hypothetical protein